MLINFNKNDYHIDRRIHQRADVNLPSIINAGDSARIPGIIKEISVSGLKLESKSKLIEGSDLEILLKLDASLGCHHLLFNGRVVRSIMEDEGSLYAVAYTDISPRVTRFIDSFIYYQHLNKDKSIVIEG